MLNELLLSYQHYLFNSNFAMLFVNSAHEHRDWRFSWHQNF